MVDGVTPLFKISKQQNQLVFSESLHQTWVVLATYYCVSTPNCAAKCSCFLLSHRHVSSQDSATKRDCFVAMGLRFQRLLTTKCGCVFVSRPNHTLTTVSVVCRNARQIFPGDWVGVFLDIN